MDLTVTVVVVAFGAVVAGAIVQGSVGFGMNLVVVPVLALVAPDALPAVAVMLGIPIGAAMARHELHAVDRRGVAWIFTGRVPGTLVGTAIVVAVSSGTLEVLVGIAVLLAVAMSLAAPPIPVRPATMAAAGAVGGITGTAAGIGGPPLALLYQHHEGPVIRSTLAASFLLGTALSVTTLAIAGEVSWSQVALALVLAPATIIGSRTARRAARFLDAGYVRPAVLTFAAVSATVVIVNGLR
jgi:uncharacterized membrane protein YfcA